MKEITLDAVVDNIPAVTSFVEEELDKYDCSFKVKTQIDIAIDELFGNIAHYAYADNAPGKATVQVDYSDNPSTVSVTFIDGGIPYNPLDNSDPDITLSAAERAIGGLGIFMVKKTMDNITYDYRDNKNILTIYKVL